MANRKLHSRALRKAALLPHLEAIFRQASHRRTALALPKRTFL
jgi:hypothetical protein